MNFIRPNFGGIFQRYHRLHNIKTLLCAFRSAASEIRDESYHDLAPINASLQQLKDLAQLTKDIDRSRILQNVLIAAMNLRQIMSYANFHELEGPGEISANLRVHLEYVY